jgi:hypothetical protein
MLATSPSLPSSPAARVRARLAAPIQRARRLHTIVAVLWLVVFGAVAESLVRVTLHLDDSPSSFALTVEQVLVTISGAALLVLYAVTFPKVLLVHAKVLT